jgi:hypothetical protein
MSLDARYIFVYDVQGYVGKSPMDIDKDYLKEKFGGEFEYIDGYSVFLNKPKYTLLPHEIDNLHADQVLERQDGELWKIIK